MNPVDYSLLTNISRCIADRKHIETKTITCKYKFSLSERVHLSFKFIDRKQSELTLEPLALRTVVKSLI